VIYLHIKTSVAMPTEVAHFACSRGSWRASFLERQTRLCPIESVNLALLIDAKDDRLVRGLLPKQILQACAYAETRNRAAAQCLIRC